MSGPSQVNSLKLIPYFGDQQTFETQCINCDPTVDTQGFLQSFVQKLKTDSSQVKIKSIVHISQRSLYSCKQQDSLVI